MTSDRLLYRIEIHATPDRVWQAITDPEWTRKYFHETSIRSSWKIGSPVYYDMPDGSLASEGTLLEYDPPHRLVMTMRFTFDETLGKEPPSRVTYELEPRGDTTVLTLIHDQIPPYTREMVKDGWIGIIEGLARVLAPDDEPAVSRV
jgi:uncharacterized protein YndB with AHSA1/START domain